MPWLQICERTVFSTSGYFYEISMLEFTLLGDLCMNILLEFVDRLYDLVRFTLNWMDKNSRSTIEMKDASSRPEIGDTCTNMDEYDVIFVGFPIWWYVAPTIINTFLESYDFSNKTIVPFCTSGGSGVGKTDSILHQSCNDLVNWKPCKLLKSNMSNQEILNWINSLNI